MVIMQVGFAQSLSVVDFYEALSAQEIENLSNRIEKIREDHFFDVVVVITENMEGKSSRDFADDFYDFNAYGLDSQNSGILMLINMADREVWVSTTGRGIEVFTDQRIDVMTDRIIVPLADGDFYKSVTVFLDDVATYLSRGVPANQVTTHSPSQPLAPPKTYFQRVLSLVGNPIVYVIALIISAVSTFALSLNSKGKKTTHSKTYEAEGSFDLSRKEDVYIREHISKVPLPKDPPKNTSSTHRGSSGVKHGGGGKKF